MEGARLAFGRKIKEVDWPALGRVKGAKLRPKVLEGMLEWPPERKLSPPLKQEPSFDKTEPPYPKGTFS